MTIKIDKPRLPKSRAYVLLEKALDGVVETECDVLLRYWTPLSGSSILEGEYWLPNENRPATLFVRAGSLPVDDVEKARGLLTVAVLPEFARWFVSVLRLSDRSTELHAKPRFDAVYGDGQIVINRNPR